MTSRQPTTTVGPSQYLMQCCRRSARWARKKGNHSAFEFMAQDLGYTKPTPIEPKDEMAELQRQFIAAVEKQVQASETAKAMLDRLEQLQQRPQLRSAA